MNCFSHNFSNHKYKWIHFYSRQISMIEVLYCRIDTRDRYLSKKFPSLPANIHHTIQFDKEKTNSKMIHMNNCYNDKKCFRLFRLSKQNMLIQKLSICCFEINWMVMNEMCNGGWCEFGSLERHLNSIGFHFKPIVLFFHSIFELLVYTLILTTFYIDFSTVVTLSTTSTSIIDLFKSGACLSLQNETSSITVNESEDNKIIFLKCDQIGFHDHCIIYLPNWQKMLLLPISLLHSVFASQIYFCIHFSDELPTVFT